jgi:hypothetical protein
MPKKNKGKGRVVASDSGDMPLFSWLNQESSNQRGCAVSHADNLVCFDTWVRTNKKEKISSDFLSAYLGLASKHD